MTSNVTASITDGGATIGNGASAVGTGLVSGTYSCLWGTGDPLVFNDFKIIKFVNIQFSGGTATTIQVDANTANIVNVIPGELNFGASSTARVTAHVIGTKA